MVQIGLVAEDDLSMAALDRVCTDAGRDFVVARRLVERGVGNIKRSLDKYRQASHVIPHVVLADLDRNPCPPALLAEWRADRLPANMMLRLAVRATESWLLGDREAFSDFVGVPNHRVPMRPEEEPDPKASLIGIVRRSRLRRLRQEIVPTPGTLLKIEPEYNERLTQYVLQHWRPKHAARACPSLARFTRRLGEFMT